MSKAGNDYWRLHVEIEAGVHPPDTLEGVAAVARRDGQMWDAMPDRDKEEVRRRLEVAKGD